MDEKMPPEPTAFPDPVESEIQDPDQGYSTTMASKFLGLSPSYLAKLRTKGGGPEYYKSGSNVCYRKRQLVHWQQRHERSSTSEG